jgi:hypothetical protein
VKVDNNGLAVLVIETVFTQQKLNVCIAMVDVCVAIALVPLRKMGAFVKPPRTTLLQKYPVCIAFMGWNRSDHV